jgi:RimJ/RimL family protein N-acetyltransferase
LAAARHVDDSVPVIAWIVEQNDASVRVAKRLGLTDFGPHTDPSDGHIRRVYCDRPMPAHDW